jgi:hypothetical protein
MPDMTIPWRQALVLALVLLAATARAFNRTVYATVPSPPPLVPLGTNATVFVLLNQSAYNDSLGVPAWERTDGAPTPSAPDPTMVAIDDFVLPPSISSCDTLTVDVGVMRAEGRSAANDLLPTGGTVWLFADGAVPTNATFMQSAPLALAAVPFVSPTEPAGGAWASPSTGYMLPVGHIWVETLRFALG